MLVHGDFNLCVPSEYGPNERTKERNQARNP